MVRKAMLVYTICLLSFIPIIKADPSFLSIDCPTTTTYVPNSTYQTNVDILFSVLSSNSTVSNGFYKFTAGSSPPDISYGLFLCRGDMTATACQDCVTYATADIVKNCPWSKVASIWYEECMLTYSNASIFTVLETGGGVRWNVHNVTNATRLNEVLGAVMNDITHRASSDDSGKKFATAEADYSPNEKIYGLAQCTPDLSDSQCNTCLGNCISQFPSCCNAKKGGIILFKRCNVRYEMYHFYNASFGAAPPPSPALPSPPPTGSHGNGGISSKVIVAIAVSTGVGIMLFIAGSCCLSKRKKKKCDSINVGEDMTTVQSLQFDFSTIQAATENFLENNKIGEGGFGSVYKGLLPDGQEVAVKRLSQTSGQGAVEFKNEATLVAKLQHRNLVRLLGFCLEGEEKILIYEYVPNRSLDYFLFDSQVQTKLDWARRYKIIGGIARGMLYLHEDSRLKIIHRDLKPSNILLDGDMNAKVSDFGTARIFGVDQTQGNTNQVVGTFGYMSPEYVRQGQFSTKSDVFSFGVLILEIISGKKNRNFYQSDGDADLLTYAWKLWREGTSFDLMDPTLEGSYARNEVTRCIHIALLCVQNDPDARPSMGTVVLMLNSHSTTLALPQLPGFLGQSRNLESNQSTSESIEWSVNEASITELGPR